MNKGWLILIISVLAGSPCPGSTVSKNKKGNKAFKKGKYKEAISHYQDAEVEAPEKKALSYNLGNALYRANQFDDAAKAYERGSKAREKKLKKKVLFNSGNAFYRAGSNFGDPSSQEKLKQAVKLYKEVLKLDPYDQNAKFNLQKALEKLEQQKQQQQKQNKDGKDKKDQDKKENQKGDNQKDQQQQQQQQQEKDKQQPQQKQQQQQKKPGEMSKEEAKRLLDALQQDEKELQKKRMMMMVKPKKLEKDW